MGMILTDKHDPRYRTTVDISDDGDIAITHEEDVTDLLERNQRIRSAIGTGITRDKDAWRHIGGLPMSMYFDLRKRGAIARDGTVHDQMAVRKLLNDISYSKLKTCDGKV